MKNTELENIHKSVKTDKKLFVLALDELTKLSEKIAVQAEEIRKIDPQLLLLSKGYGYNHNDGIIEFLSKIKDASTFEGKDLEMLKLLVHHYAPFLGAIKETREKVLEYLKVEGKFYPEFYENIPKLKRIINSLDPYHKITGSRSSGYEIRDPAMAIVHLKDTYSNVFSGHERNSGMSVNLDLCYSFNAVGANWTIRKTVIKHGSFKPISEREMMFVLKDSSCMWTIKNHHKSLKNLPDYVKDHLLLQ